MQNEPIQIFKNGCMYYANTINTNGGFSLPEKIGFHTFAFYQAFDEHKIIATLRTPIMDYTRPLIRRILNQEASLEEMQTECFNVLVNLLRQDPARDWYKDKNFIMGTIYPENIQAYIKKNQDFPIEERDLVLRDFCLLK